MPQRLFVKFNNELNIHLSLEQGRSKRFDLGEDK